MKVSELRIGNIIEIDQYPNDRVITTIECGNDIDQVIKLNGKPIPLTEEWLLKFGFEKKYKSYEKCDFTFLQGGFDKLAYKLTIIENTPKYVHQLQNLYFALTGEELTFK